jgi:iron complex outermembrane recepter protein
VVVSGSLRYSREEKTGNATHAVTGVLPPTFRPYNLKEKRSEGLWDYSARVRYEFTPDASVYLSYATGTKGGGFVSNDSLLLTNILAGLARFQYEDEQAKSWELGGKFRFFGGRGALNVALFHTKFLNLQVSQFNGTAFVTGNAAEATTKGVELDTIWKLGPFLQVGGNLGYLDARYDDYPGGQCLFNAPPGCLPQNNNLAGSRLVRAPEWKGEAFIEADYPVGGWEVSGRISADYTSRSYFQPDLHPLNSQKAFTKWNARVALRPADAPWEVALIGRNLTNEATLSQAFNNPNFGGNSHVVMVGQPRMVTLEFSLRY